MPRKNDRKRKGQKSQSAVTKDKNHNIRDVKIRPKRIIEQNAKKYGMIEADALVAIALADASNDFEDNDQSDNSHDGMGSVSTTESSYDVDLERMLGQQKPRGLIASRFEVESLVKVGRRRDETISTEHKKSNVLLIFCLALLVICTVLLYDRKRTNLLLASRESSNSSTTDTSSQTSSLDDFKKRVGGNMNDHDNNIDPKYSNAHKSSDLITPGHKSEQYKEEMKLFDEVDDSLSKLSQFTVWNRPFDVRTDVPFYWHIPMAGGTTMEDIMSHCIGLVEANEIGVTHGHSPNEPLSIFQLDDGGKYVNVDTTTLTGLKRAKDVGLVQSGLSDVIISSYLYEASELFIGTNRRAKCFTIMRHPIRRAIALFYEQQQQAKAMPVDIPNAFRNMTIEEYVQGPYVEENWMVRFLTNVLEGPLAWHHLELAKEVLGRKCLVGFLDTFHESVTRFDDYFRWDENVRQNGGNYATKEQCIKQLMDHGDNTHQHPKHNEGEKVWDMFMVKNSFDMQIYTYARELYEKQTLYG